MILEVFSNLGDSLILEENTLENPKTRSICYAAIYTGLHDLVSVWPKKTAQHNEINLSHLNMATFDIFLQDGQV